MKKLTAEQRLSVRTFLTEQGLTFNPLLEEMLDHVSSDIEEHMQDGLSFDEAWHQMKKDIPENHLQNIQIETMETINKRFSVSRALSILALVLMFVGITFKILHLRGASELLLSSFAAMAGSFLSGTVSGIYFHKEKKGAVRVLSIVAGTLLLLAAYTFRIMHWPGADTLVSLGVGVSLMSFLFNTLYIFRSSSRNANLLSYLHEKHSPGIERFLLILLVPVAILRMINMPVPANAFLGTIIFVTIIYGAGLQFFALTWRLLEADAAKRNVLTFSALVLSFTCFSLVFLGELLGFEIRLVLIMLFSIFAVWIIYKIDPPKNFFLGAVLILIPILFTGNVLLRLNLIPGLSTVIVFNFVILLVLTAGVFMSTKHEATRAFLILSMAGYLVEYSGKLI
jgi:hypothetical protein